MKYTDLCARLDYLSSPDAEHMPDGARLTSIIRCAVEAATAIRELEAELDHIREQRNFTQRQVVFAEARVAELTRERDAERERCVKIVLRSKVIDDITADAIAAAIRKGGEA
jgi:hypothetical protein